MTKQARAARTSQSDLVARYVIEKSLETEFPGISFRDSLSGRTRQWVGRICLLVKKLPDTVRELSTVMAS